MEIVTTIILAILSSTVINTILTFIFDRIKEKRTHRNRFDEALRLILLSDIKDIGRDYIKCGKVNAIDLQAFNEMYSCYKGLGGDGYADQIHEKVNELEIKI